MITTTLIATAAVLSCWEAQTIIAAIDTSALTREAHYELVGTLMEVAPGSCPFIIDTDGPYRTVPADVFDD